MLDHAEDGVVLDVAVRVGRRLDPAVEGRVRVAVETVEEGGWEPASGEGRRERAVGDGEEFVDEALGERLRGVDEDELLALLGLGGRDEGDDADRERCRRRLGVGVLERRHPLLAVDDPPRLLVVGGVGVDGDDEDAERPPSPRGQVSRGRLPGGSNQTPFSKATTSALGRRGASDSRYVRMAAT